jgi:hypothetical protein
LPIVSRSDSSNFELPFYHDNLARIANTRCDRETYFQLREIYDYNQRIKSVRIAGDVYIIEWLNWYDITDDKFDTADVDYAIELDGTILRPGNSNDRIREINSKSLDIRRFRFSNFGVWDSGNASDSDSD